MNTKICRICEEEKPAIAFAHHKRQCKVCKNSADRAATQKKVKITEWDGKFNTDMKRMQLSIKEQAIRLAAFKDEFIRIFCQSEKHLTVSELSSAFSIQFNVGESKAKNLIAEQQWWPEILRARESGDITPVIKTNWHIEPWNKSASCYA